MEYGILGPVQVWDGGVEIPLDGEKQRTVLAALLIAEGSLLSDARLSWFLWGDRPPATRTAQLYNSVSRLRRALGPRVRVARRAHGYVLAIGSASLDLLRFRDLARQGRSAIVAERYREAGNLLREALTLWRGPVLSNASEHLAAAEGPVLEETRIAVLAGRIEADLAAGLHPQMLPELTRVVAQYPLHERFRAQLMTALYRCDRQAEALTIYYHGRQLLGHELGVEPGPLLRDVHRAILTSDPCLHRPLDQWR